MSNRKHSQTDRPLTATRTKSMFNQLAAYDINDFLPSRNKPHFPTTSHPPIPSPLRPSPRPSTSYQNNNPQPSLSQRGKSGAIQKIRRNEGVQATPIKRNESTQMKPLCCTFARQYQLSIAAITINQDYGQKTIQTVGKEEIGHSNCCVYSHTESCDPIVKHTPRPYNLQRQQYRMVRDKSSTRLGMAGRGRALECGYVLQSQLGRILTMMAN